MKLYELLKRGQAMLEDHDVPDADIDSDLLWQHLSGMSRTDMLFDRDMDISSDIEHDYITLIEKRCRSCLLYTSDAADDGTLV